MHVYTCDYTEEGSLLFIGGSTSHLEGVELPQKLDGWGADRMDIQGRSGGGSKGRPHQDRLLVS